MISTQIIQGQTTLPTDFLLLGLSCSLWMLVSEGIVYFWLTTFEIYFSLLLLHKVFKDLSYLQTELWKGMSFTWTVALGNQARATKICSLMVSPDPNTTQKDTIILTNSPMASTAIPNPKTKSEKSGLFFTALYMYM